MEKRNITFQVSFFSCDLPVKKKNTLKTFKARYFFPDIFREKPKKVKQNEAAKQHGIRH